MNIDELGKMWKNKHAPVEPDLLKQIIRVDRKEHWRKYGMLIVFVMVVSLVGLFIDRLQLENGISRIGIVVGLTAMVLMMVLRLFTRVGTERYEMSLTNLEFLRQVHRRYKYSRWLRAWGVIFYTLPFALAFIFIVPEMADQFGASDKIWLMIGLGLAYLVFITVQGIIRARREYKREMHPAMLEVEKLIAELEANGQA